MSKILNNFSAAVSKIMLLCSVFSVLIAVLSSTAIASFTDVKSSNDYYDAISYLESVGIVKGYSDGSFKPDNSINRAEIMKILVEGLGITPDVEDYSDCFYDVGEEWFAPYICYAKSKGWVKGYGDGYFRPANYVNRVEAVKMVINIEGFEDELSSSVSLPFNDTDSSQWYAVYLEAADDLRLLTESSGAFYPANNTTRGYLSEMIFRGLVIKGTDVSAYTESAKEGFLNPETEVHIPTGTETAYAESLIENKEVFVISDENWEGVLSFLPAVQNHPYLIVHNSNGVLDIDSAIYFIEDYNPSRITLVGDFGSNQSYFEDYAQVNTIELVNTLEYWEGFNAVVYTSDNYESSLLSVPLAAFKEIPFVIEGDIFDREEVFQDRTVYLVDGTQCPDSAESCVEMNSTTDVQEELLDYVDGGKLILVEPSDINEGQAIDDFESVLSGELIEDGLSKDSLASVVLAVQKEELILPVGFNTVSSVQNDIEDFVDSFNLDPEYLTIVSNPSFIDQTNYDEESEIYYELDNSYYGDLDGDKLTDLKVGRIYGITSTDTSSTIARSIYYDDLSVTEEVSLLWAPDFIQMLSLTYELESWFEKAGYEPTVHSKGNMDCENWEECFRDLEFDLKQALEDQFLVVYQSHGSTSGGLMNFNTSSLRDEDIRLNSSIVMTSACSTCAYAKTSSPDSLFCLNMLRRGAVAYFGAIEDSSSNIDLPRDSIYGLLDGDSLGEVLFSFKERSYYRTRITSADTAPRFFDPDFVLLGDPTLTPSNDRLSSLDLEDSIQFDGTTVTIEMPAVQTDHQFDFSFYSQSSSERVFYGTAYFEDQASTLVSDYSLIGEITNSQSGSTATRTSYEYLFSLPISVDSVTNFSIEYADGREALSEEVSFVEDEEGSTWFWLTDVVDDINDSGGMPARTITFDIE